MPWQKDLQIEGDTEMTWKQVLPELARLDDPATHELFSRAQEISLPANTIVFHQGDQCSNYLLVLAGSVKVLSRAENGREIILYRLGSGDSCVLTTSCLFGNVPYPAEGSTETAVTALAIPAAAFKKAIQQSEAFRTLVFQSFTDHLASVIALVEEIAFGRLGSRLARYLLEHADAGQQIKATHQVLATELGSAREVISRQLKDLEGRGLVQLQRGCIDLQDMDALKKLAGL
jgi:CRP/FNR family transcriptional regulator